MADAPYPYDGSLEGLFALLSRALVKGKIPEFARSSSASGSDRHGFSVEGDLFSEREPACAQEESEQSLTARATEAERTLAGFSPWARLDFIYAWMSELPIERDILTFALGVISAGLAAERSGAESLGAASAAEVARTDRGDPSVRAVLAAVQKVTREEHRLIGLLRFSEETDGRMVARCACDHAVLPLLADHFSARFGGRSWAIVDERRRLALVRDPPEEARLVPADEVPLKAVPGKGEDAWAELWKGYHQAIAIDSRANPGLQRRLMPVRYWKYLTELQ